MADPAARAEHIKDTVDMYSDIANGTLPAVSYAHPDGALDGHPSSSKLDLFEAYVAEHPDQAGRQPGARGQHASSSSPSTRAAVTTTRATSSRSTSSATAPRIPLIAVSPYTKGGKVNHGYADHVSILKFIERNWC